MCDLISQWRSINSLFTISNRFLIFLNCKNCWREISMKNLLTQKKRQSMRPTQLFEVCLMWGMLYRLMKLKYFATNIAKWRMSTMSDDQFQIFHDFCSKWWMNSDRWRCFRLFCSQNMHSYVYKLNYFAKCYCKFAYVMCLWVRVEILWRSINFESCFGRINATGNLHTFYERSNHSLYLSGRMLRLIR